MQGPLGVPLVFTRNPARDFIFFGFPGLSVGSPRRIGGRLRRKGGRVFWAGVLFLDGTKNAPPKFGALNSGLR